MTTTDREQALGGWQTIDTAHNEITAAAIKQRALEASSGVTGDAIADAIILGFLHGVGRQPWNDMHDYIAVSALDYARGKPGAREHLAPLPPAPVSTNEVGDE